MPNGIHYICNAGVMLECTGKKILIDALIYHNHMLFDRFSPELEAKIINGEDNFAHIDIYLATHHHQDHFEPELVANFLRKHPETSFVGTETSVELLRPLAPENAKIIEVNPALFSAESLQINGVQVKALRLVHSGAKYADVKNIAYIINCGTNTFVHTGDAAHDANNAKALALHCPEKAVIIAPFPYITLPLAHQHFKDTVKPSLMFAMHLPRPEKDQGEWIKAAQSAAEKRNTDELKIILAELPGACFEV